MLNDNSLNNKVNGTGINDDEGASFSRCPVDEQHRPGYHQATARQKWSEPLNRLVMYCKFKRGPNRRGYRKRMMEVWKDKGVFELCEQRLVDQARAIMVNKWLIDVELEEIMSEIGKEDTDITANGSNKQERTQFEGDHSESDTREQGTRIDACIARGDRIENDNDNFEGLDLREGAVFSGEEMDQMNIICNFYNAETQPPKVTFKTVNKKNIHIEINKLGNIIKGSLHPT